MLVALGVRSQGSQDVRLQCPLGELALRVITPVSRLAVV